MYACMSWLDEGKIENFLTFFFRSMAWLDDDDDDANVLSALTPQPLDKITISTATMQSCKFTPELNLNGAKCDPSSPSVFELSQNSCDSLEQGRSASPTPQHSTPPRAVTSQTSASNPTDEEGGGE